MCPQLRCESEDLRRGLGSSRPAKSVHAVRLPIPGRWPSRLAGSARKSPWPLRTPHAPNRARSRTKPTRHERAALREQRRYPQEDFDSSRSLLSSRTRRYPFPMCKWVPPIRVRERASEIWPFTCQLWNFRASPVVPPVRPHRYSRPEQNFRDAAQPCYGQRCSRARAERSLVEGEELRTAFPVKD